jgi:hypothetical protein
MHDRVPIKINVVLPRTIATLPALHNYCKVSSDEINVSTRLRLPIKGTSSKFVLIGKPTKRLFRGSNEVPSSMPQIHSTPTAACAENAVRACDLKPTLTQDQVQNSNGQKIYRESVRLASSRLSSGVSCRSARSRRSPGFTLSAKETNFGISRSGF